jgi:hypothetical protein
MMRRGKMSTLRLIALMLCLATVLMGCSANRFIYNRADTFVRWVVDDYVDLNRDQQAAFDTQLQQFLDVMSCHSIDSSLCPRVML